jgi:hypothetical protein
MYEYSTIGRVSGYFQRFRAVHDPRRRILCRASVSVFAKSAALSARQHRARPIAGREGNVWIAAWDPVHRLEAKVTRAVSRAYPTKSYSQLPVYIAGSSLACIVKVRLVG